MWGAANRRHSGQNLVFTSRRHFSLQPVTACSIQSSLGMQNDPKSRRAQTWLQLRSLSRDFDHLSGQSRAIQRFSGSNSRTTSRRWRKTSRYWRHSSHHWRQQVVSPVAGGPQTRGEHRFVSSRGLCAAVFACHARLGTLDCCRGWPEWSSRLLSCVRCRSRRWTHCGAAERLGCSLVCSSQAEDQLF